MLLLLQEGGRYSCCCCKRAIQLLLLLLLRGVTTHIQQLLLPWSQRGNDDRRAHKILTEMSTFKVIGY